MKKTVITFFVFFLFFSGKPEESHISTIDSVQELKLKIDGLNQSLDVLNRIYDEKGI